MMRKIAGCLLGVLLAFGAGVALPAPLGDNTVKLEPSKFRLLQNIGPMRYSGTNRYSDRRLGRSFGYGASGISLTIYVYDYGMHDIPDGPDSVQVCEQYERAKHEIETGGNYQNVVLRSEAMRRMSVRGLADAPRAREAVYELDRNGNHALSMLWLTAADGYFVKLRLSLRGEVEDELEDARDEILASLSQAFAARPPRVVSNPAPQPETSMEIDPANDAAEAQVWVTYASELLKAARETPGSWPPCGGPLVPTFAIEQVARRAALLDYLARSSRTSEYFTQLAQVEAAGFFDEYVWHYLRNEAVDQSPPAGLDLAGFEIFRQQQLATHVVKTGAHVRVNILRSLPLAPAP